MPLETTAFDAEAYLETHELQHAFLSEALQSGDVAHIKHALNIVTRARGVAQTAKDAGVTREALYKAFSENGDPKLSTFFGVLNALGVKVSAEAAE